MNDFLDVRDVYLSLGQCFDQITRETQKKPKKGWFGWWGGSKSTSTEQDSTENLGLLTPLTEYLLEDHFVYNVLMLFAGHKFYEAMTDEEKAKLYKSIGYEGSAPESQLPKEVIYLQGTTTKHTCFCFIVVLSFLSSTRRSTFKST